MENNNFIKEIIDYENKVFTDFLNKRDKMIENLKTIDTDKLDNEQLLILTSDIKQIIDPVKIASDNIDYLFSNIDFKKNDSIESTKEIYKILILSSFFPSFTP